MNSNQCVLFTVDPAAYKLELIDSIASANISYLQTSVSIILGSAIFLSVLMYFRFYSPMSAKLNAQEQQLDILVEKIEEERRAVRGKYAALQTQQKNTLLDLERSIHLLEKKSSEKLEKITHATDNIATELKDKLKKLDRLIAKTDSETKFLSAQISWNNHYMWEARNIPDNVLSSLEATISKSLVAKCYWLISLALSSVINVLPKVNQNDEDVIEDLKNILSHLEGIEKKHPSVDMEELKELRIEVRKIINNYQD